MVCDSCVPDCRTTRVDVRTPPPGSGAAARTRSDFLATPTSSVAFSNGPSNRMLSGSDYRCGQQPSLTLAHLTLNLVFWQCTVRPDIVLALLAQYHVP